MIITAKDQATKLMNHIKELKIRETKWVKIIANHGTKGGTEKLQMVCFREREFLMLDSDTDLLFSTVDITGNISNDAVHYIYNHFLSLDDVDYGYMDITKIYKDYAKNDDYFLARAHNEIHLEEGSVIRVRSQASYNVLMDALTESGYFWSLQYKANQANIWAKSKEETVVFINGYNKKLLHLSSVTSSVYHFKDEDYEKINVNERYEMF